MIELDLNGDPIVGAKAFFYNQGTTTPQTVYSDASLSEAYSTDSPVETDGKGRWPSVYLSPDPGAYRVRVVDADGAVVYDDDGIDVPLAAAYTPPEAGETSTTLLFQTGDIKVRYGTGTLTGYVRLNGRSIGSATSGATERANSDCEDLFEHLWNADSNLSVSGGRGANAAADWAANKRLTLPDMRDRMLIGLGGMGNSDAGLISDSLVDGGGTNTTLGATVGASTVSLATANLPSHTHSFSGTTNSSGSHTHEIFTRDDVDHSEGSRVSNTSSPQGARDINTASAGAHTHTFSGTTGSAGSGTAHNNMPPGMFVTFYVKL